MRTLVAQAETKQAHDGYWFGYEVFEVDGQFRLVIHTSTYDGVRRDSHYATPEVPMMAPTTREEAIEQAKRTTSLYARSLLGQAVG